MGKNELPALWDMHCHVLPGVDDGCKTVEESLRVLRTMHEQGIKGVIATPHYYPEETVAEFLARRNTAAESLCQQAEGEGYPQICLGAEVAYHPGLIYEEDIHKLCIGRSNYMLLEMPFSRWTPSVLRNVSALRHVQGVIPIIAHLERYMHFQNKSTITELLDSGALIQMNGEYILDVKTRRKGLKLLRKGMVDVLGSDCHNMTTRPPVLAAAVQTICSLGCEMLAMDICDSMQEICEDATG